MRDRFGSRFDAPDDPLASMANLVDVMLVFACGLIAALVSSGLVEAPSLDTGRQVEEQHELPEVPEGIGESSSGGYEAVGQVYRDPKSGKLFLVGD